MAKAKRRMPTDDPMMDQPGARRAGVMADLARLGGRSRSDLEGDDRRGPASPLGMGSHSKKVEKVRGR